MQSVAILPFQERQNASKKAFGVSSKLGYELSIPPLPFATNRSKFLTLIPQLVNIASDWKAISLAGCCFNQGVYSAFPVRHKLKTASPSPNITFALSALL